MSWPLVIDTECRSFATRWNDYSLAPTHWTAIPPSLSRALPPPSFSFLLCCSSDDLSTDTRRIIRTTASSLAWRFVPSFLLFFFFPLHHHLLLSLFRFLRRLLLTGRAVSYAAAEKEKGGRTTRCGRRWKNRRERWERKARGKDIKWEVEDVEKVEEVEKGEGERRSHRVSDKIHRARSGTLFSVPSLPLSFLLIARASPSRLSLAASALVPSPRPLAGACFFPTRSSGIPPLLTAASASPARGWTRIRFWETFLFGRLSSPPLTLRTRGGDISSVYIGIADQTTYLRSEIIAIRSGYTCSKGNGNRDCLFHSIVSSSGNYNIKHLRHLIRDFFQNFVPIFFCLAREALMYPDTARVGRLQHSMWESWTNMKQARWLPANSLFLVFHAAKICLIGIWRLFKQRLCVCLRGCSARDISSRRVTLPVNFCLFSYGIATAVATSLLYSLAERCWRFYGQSRSEVALESLEEIKLTEMC